MANLLAKDISSDGTALYTFSDFPKKKFTKIPGQEIYVNQEGETLYYNEATKSYVKTSLRPKLIAPSSSQYTTTGKDMDDGKTSRDVMKKLNSKKFSLTSSIGLAGVADGGKVLNTKSDPVKALMHQNNLYTSDEMDLYNKTYKSYYSHWKYFN